MSNEIVHEMDLFPTLAGIAGGKVPGDRIIDGVDQLNFFKEEQEASNREHVIIYVGSDLYGVKWRNYKMMSKEIDKAFADPTRTYGVPLIYDLHVDPKEENPLNYNGIIVVVSVGLQVMLWSNIWQRLNKNHRLSQEHQTLTNRQNDKLQY